MRLRTVTGHRYETRCQCGSCSEVVPMSDTIKVVIDLDLGAEAIVRTYEERTKVEEEFRWMKGDEMMPFAPLFVRKDESILAHAFMAVMGMMLWRLTWKWIRAEGILEEERDVLEALDELDLVLMSRARHGELRGGEWKIAEHGALAEELLQSSSWRRRCPGGGAVLRVQGTRRWCRFHLGERGVSPGQL